MIQTMAANAAGFLIDLIDFLMTPVCMSFVALGIVVYICRVVKLKLLP